MPANIKGGTPTAKSAAQRKAEERGRKREAGRTVVQVWVHPDDREKLAHYIRRLNERRDRKT